MPSPRTCPEPDDPPPPSPRRRHWLLAPLILLAGPGQTLAAPLPATPPAAAGPPLLTVLDGDVVLLRGADKLAAAEGLALRPDDLLEVPASSRLARIEFADGATLALGPGSRALLAPRLGPTAPAGPGARVYLLAGWAKLAAPAGIVAGLAAPALEVATRGGTLVLSVAPGGPATLFAEDGEAELRQPREPAPRPVRAGEALTLDAEGARLADRPSPAFVAAVPRAFRDPLPARAAAFRARPPVEPRRIGALDYDDARPWLDAEPRLRQAYLPRWRPLARDPAFRRGLIADLPAHPEWRPVLFPPPPPRPAPAPATRTPAP